MDCAFGLTGKDYVLLASDMSAGRSIIQMKSDENKIKALGPHLAMAYNGEPGDTNNFADYVDRNLRLFQIRNNVPLSPASASSWIRRTLAESIRSRSPYAVNLLLGGLDTAPAAVAANGDVPPPHLYWFDYLGTKATVPYAAHGLGQYVCLSTMDKWWKPEIDREEGVEVLKKCLNEVEKRLTVKYNFNCIIITPKGIFPVDLKAADPLEAAKAGDIEGQGTAAAAGLAVPNPPVEVGA